LDSLKKVEQNGRCDAGLQNREGYRESNQEQSVFLQTQELMHTQWKL